MWLRRSQTALQVLVLVSMENPGANAPFMGQGLSLGRNKN